MVARNTLYNIGTQGLLIVMALWAIPHIVSGLTRDGFGLLAIVWAFVGYLALLDFGISRANTKFLAEAVAAGNMDEIRRLVWLSLWVSGGIGVASGAALFVATPWLVTNVLKIADPFRIAGLETFRFAACSVPFLLLFGALRGAQMAMQRFDLVNIFQLLQGLTQWAGAVVLVRAGYGLEQVVLLTIGARVLLALAAFVVMPRLVPAFFARTGSWDRKLVKKIFVFGGWVTVSQIISPFFLYLDRLFIGRLLSLEAVTLYTVPQEALARVLIVPVSLTATLFPAFSGQLLHPPEASKAGATYYRSLKYLLAAMVPLIFLLVVHADTILRLWMGEDFARQATGVFRILAIGLFFNALAQVPVAFLHARGNPRLTALFHLAELPLMILLNLLLIPAWGIMGAAFSWMVRVLVDAILLFLGVQTSSREYLSTAYRPSALWRYVPLVAGGAAFTVVLSTVPLSAIQILSASAVALALMMVITWRYCFDETDRSFLLLRLKFSKVPS